MNLSFVFSFLPLNTNACFLPYTWSWRVYILVTLAQFVGPSHFHFHSKRETCTHESSKKKKHDIMATRLLIACFQMFLLEAVNHMASQRHRVSELILALFKGKQNVIQFVRLWIENQPTTRHNIMLVVEVVGYPWPWYYKKPSTRL